MAVPLGPPLAVSEADATRGDPLPLLLERLSPLRRGGCWCGRSLYGSAHGLRFAAVPGELEFLRGNAFHSASCAVAFLSDLSRSVERGLVSLYAGDRRLDPREARSLLVGCVDTILGSEIAWR
ncbi:MAG: hypothetical protein L3K13_07575 [Thermoplasmata archaeon]|nr:hypothetical protein [Thermoplasmata archaeon]